MKDCNECEVIKSLNNAWHSLCIEYDNTTDENIRVALNFLSKITRKIESDFCNIKKENEPKQITIEEWISFFKTGV